MTAPSAQAIITLAVVELPGRQTEANMNHRFSARKQRLFALLRATMATLTRNAQTESPRIVRHLPSDAKAIAYEYASALDLEDELEQPLAIFFGRASKIPGIEGFGLALSYPEDGVPFLSISALTNLDDLGRARPDSARPLVSDEFRHLEESLDDAVLDRVDIGFGFLDTRGQGIEGIARDFPHGVIDPFIGEGPVESPRSSEVIRTQ